MKRPLHVVGFGKAVLEMALAVEEILGESMKESLISIPVGALKNKSIPAGSRIEVLEGAKNNLPGIKLATLDVADRKLPESSVLRNVFNFRVR